MTDPQTPRHWALGALAICVVAGGLVPDLIEWHGNLFDDAYIYLRYAQNNVQGCVLEWNCGAGRVEGFTSPLYLSLLTMLSLLSVDLEAAASWLGIATWFVAIAGFTVLPIVVSKQLDGEDEPFPAGWASLLIALPFVADQLIAINIASGMEGGLVACALLLVAWLAFRPDALAWVAPTMVLIRPELGLATLLQPILGRAALKRAAVAAALVFGFVTVLRFALFTDVLPNTFWAKSGGSADHLAAGATYVISAYSRFPVALLAALGLLSRHRALRYLAMLVIGWSLYFFWSGGDFYPYARVFAFLVPLAGFVGVVSGLELLQRFGNRRAVAVLGLIIALLASSSRLTRDDYGGGEGAFQNVETWAATGHWLGRCLPGHSIAATPIGALAYFSGSPVFDVVGLADPVVAVEGERASGDGFIVGHERVHPGWTLSLGPSVIFLDVQSDAPIDSSKRLELMWVESRLLEELARQKLPYVSVSAPVNGVFQLLFIRRAVAVNELDRRCLQPDQNTP